MPSPFPGMDPYLEDQNLWEDFHHELISTMAALLVPQVLPRYWVAIEKRMYIDYEEDAGRSIRPDLAVTRKPEVRGRVAPATQATTLQPVAVEAVMTWPVREGFLKIIRRADRKVVTKIELLSVTNKKKGTSGRAEYLSKRLEVLGSESHLVEIDLLRGGERPPFKDPLPPGEYFVAVHRFRNRPRADAYGIALQRELPVIPIPLEEGDPDVGLSLGRALSETYDRRRYDHEIDYAGEASPRLEGADREWAEELLDRAHKRPHPPVS
ncbi:MAG: DUF4058 family protein [Planctomycetes bacterium]|nr:DUF4058 family protein [Planctomycetota bacterium]